ncbi:EamA family transporter [Viridibacillus sp. YIM B01967]|uniref:EamA family transporter n=1 Tax=Viridibacillus soli TaxID=2798301 RepID=A0ABS1H9N0_9BACL|nr:EamA family transporter [Viridibacillus soli]MBK3496127.1 EamA family transporter [Viridibacillus soli]
MWFLFAILTWLAWGAANLFYKKGSDSNDKNSHTKITIMVGLVMGIHATIYMFVKGLEFHPQDMLTYLPVSALYIISMIFGYIGLRYLELSIAAPVQNASGAVTTLLLYMFFPQEVTWVHFGGIIAIIVGVFWIAVIEKQQDDALLRAQNVKIDRKYQFGFIALLFPILYALIDGVGTFADGIYLDEMKIMGEDAALLAYEYTFFIVAVVCYIYLRFYKKVKFNVFKERDRTYAAVLETIGQFFYVYAISSYAFISAPIISSYCIFSIILSRIFLKEKLSKKQYLVIAIIMIGIVILGLADEL